MTAIHKQFILAFVTAVISALFFFFLSFLLSVSPSWPLTAAVILTSLIWVAIVTISLVLLTDPWPASLVLVCPPLLLFAFGRSLPAGVAAVLLLVILLSARYSSQMRGWLHPRYRTTAVFGRTAYFLIFSLVVIFAGLLLPKVIKNLSAENITVPEQVVNLILTPFTGVIKSYLPGYTPKATLDEIITAQLRSTVPSADSAALDNQRAISLQALTQKFKQPVLGREVLPELISKIVTRQLREFYNTNPLIIILLLIASLFFLARLILPLAYYPTILIISLLVALLTRYGFFYLHSLPVMTEKLSLDPVISSSPPTT